VSSLYVSFLCALSFLFVHSVGLDLIVYTPRLFPFLFIFLVNTYDGRVGPVSRATRSSGIRRFLHLYFLLWWERWRRR
jgi:hypothetical protein